MATKRIAFNQPKNPSKRQQKKAEAAAVPLAGFIRRAIGLIVDAVLVSAALGVVIWVVDGFGSQKASPLVQYLIFALGGILYAGILIGRTGSTLGEKLIQVRPVDADTGNALSWKKSFLRASIAMAIGVPALIWQAIPMAAAGSLVVKPQEWWTLVEAGLGVLPIVSYLWMVRSEKAQTLYDKLAGTVVIVKARDGE